MTKRRYTDTIAQCLSYLVSGDKLTQPTVRVRIIIKIKFYSISCLLTFLELLILYFSSLLLSLCDRRLILFVRIRWVAALVINSYPLDLFAAFIILSAFGLKLNTTIFSTKMKGKALKRIFTR